MEQVKNPFKLSGYYGPELFCDRDAETEQLIAHFQNGMNVTLFSKRRMGKTGLIQHVFHQLSSFKESKTIYIDIYDTQNLEEFTSKVVTAILQAFPEKNSIGKKFIELLKGFNPVVAYDQFTGLPEVSLSFHTPQQKQYSLNSVFQFLDKQNIHTLIAIDEFQQITHYPENNVEAILRTIIQPLKHVNFIFSGSHKHLLLEIFNSTHRPFFSSTAFLHLDKIPAEAYASFILEKFERHKKTIDRASVDFILEWTKQHTYYTQALCNKVFQLTKKTADIHVVYNGCNMLLLENEAMYFQYRNLLTTGQWNLLMAIAKDDVVYQPTSGTFIKTHQLGIPASVRRSLQALVDKEMVLQETNDEGIVFYQVYNCFLSRWLAKK